MNRFVLYIVICVVCISCNNSPNGGKKELVIFSAASLTDVVSEIVERYETNSDVDIKLNFASSGTLARQIEHGAEPAVYISANEKWVDYLIGLNCLLPESKKHVAENTLVLIAPRDSKINAVAFNSGLSGYLNGRLAIGDPKHVPAGDYAWQAMQSIGLTDECEDQILPAKDVRSALMLVELGEVELGIVYKTDAMRSEKVKVVAEISKELHSPVFLFSSILNGKNDKETQHFYNFLLSKEAKLLWQKHGFKIE